MSYSEISQCRLSGSTNLVPVLNLGKMAMTGVFPKPGERVTTGPLSLVFCPDSGLLQLRQSYDLGEMYGDNYGYRSGLNQSMVKHLQGIVAKLQKIVPLDAESAVLDIGGNDGTLLKAYDASGLQRVCIDPTVNKWLVYYGGTDIVTIPAFFPYGELGKFDIITSISCFYDLEDPHAFVAGIANHLKKDGIWHFEQSYLPAMISANSYDTVCHEHLEYYTLKVVEELLTAHGLKVIDAEQNNVNGGSFAVTAALSSSKHVPNYDNIQRLREVEAFFNKNPLGVLKEFASRVMWHRNQLTSLIHKLNNDGKSVAALGASTKGNVLLQFCGLNNDDIAYVADVNPNKRGCVTPGTKIPIVSELDAQNIPTDYRLVLPWHFRIGIIERERLYLEGGGKLIFPLPHIDIVGKEALL